MPLPDDLRMRQATDADLPVIGALREAVGWSVNGWALAAVLEPSVGRCLVVVDSLDRIVGVGSGVSYGALGIVGNMVVAEDHRRRGVGAAVLEAVIDFLLRELGSSRIELNATDEGRPLYERHGFESTGVSATGRIGRAISLETDPSIATRRAGTADLDALAAYDLPRFGGNRAFILRLLLADSTKPVIVAERDSETVGYACVHPDTPRIGPLVADSPSVAEAILATAFEVAPDIDELRLNLPPGNQAGAEWLAALGVEVEPWEGRMARGERIARREDTIYSMAAGPLG